jgi:hypothetical protein
MSSKNNGKKSNNIQYVLMDDNRTLASYGIVGSSDDIYTLQMIVAPPLTPKEIKTLQHEVYNAANAGNAKRLQTAIQAAKDGGVNLNWRNPNNYGQTPVYITAEKGNDECLSQLIAAGADVNIADNDGWTPVYIAARNWSDGCLSQLIEAGADVNIADNDGETPVYIAAFHGKEAVLAQLIEAGADVNIANICGRTPLQVATSRHASCAALLRAAGAT